MLFPSLSTLPIAALAFWAGLASTDPVSLPKVADFTHSGNGCPQTSTVGMSGNFNDLTFIFNDFAAESASSANCAVHFNAVGATPGWQVALQRVVITGYEVLAPGSHVEAYVQVFWSQNADYTRTARVSVLNDGGGTVSKTQTLVADYGGDRVWSPCSGGDGYMGIFNANFRAISSNGAYFGNGGRPAVQAKERFEWVWKRCP